MPGSGISEPDDVTLMITPPSPSAIRFATCDASRNGPLKLSPTTLSNSSSVTSWLGIAGLMPALLTRMSMRPHSA